MPEVEKSMQDCVSGWIKRLTDEGKYSDPKQIQAIAYSKCGEHKKETDDADTDDKASQVPVPTKSLDMNVTQRDPPAVPAGCVGETALRYERAGMPPVTAMARAEEDCVDNIKPVQVPDNKEVDEALFARVASGWGRIKAALNPSKPDDEFITFKVAGNHWLATWSNNFKDRDGEIFTQKAIDEYVSRVDMGIVPKPELWVWHVGKQARIGQADWVAREGHFLVASGEFDTGAQKARDYYADHASEVGVSHGFSFPKNQFDGKHYHAFNTFEISLLPRGAEANLYTSLEGVKAMALTDEKKKYLARVFDKEQVDRILASLDEKGKALEQIEVEYKDFAGTPDAADAKAVDALDTSLKELIPDLAEGSAVSLKAALDALKAVKTLRAEWGQWQKDMKPRQASSAVETTVTPTERNAALVKAIEDQMTEKDDFWHTTVKKSLNGGN